MDHERRLCDTGLAVLMDIDEEVCDDDDCIGYTTVVVKRRCWAPVSRVAVSHAHGVEERLCGLDQSAHAHTFTVEQIEDSPAACSSFHDEVA